MVEGIAAIYDEGWLAPPKDTKVHQASCRIQRPKREQVIALLPPLQFLSDESDLQLIRSLHGRGPTCKQHTLAPSVLKVYDLTHLKLCELLDGP